MVQRSQFGVHYGVFYTLYSYGVVDKTCNKEIVMDEVERHKVKQAVKESKLMKRLFDEHCELDTRVAELERQSYLTSAEEFELRILKKRKLLGVDRMMNLISEDQFVT